MSADSSRTVRRVIDPITVEALARLLGADDVATEPGSPLPPLWHWAALARWPDPAVAGDDGHPRPGSGGFVPPVPFPRRMFGAGEVTTRTPLVVGDEVDVTTSASAVRERVGRSGPLALVDLTIEVRDTAGDLLVEEIQHLVYRETATASGRRPDVRPVPQVPHLLATADDGEWLLHTDAGMLARFSALTANPHRIHLDWPYATSAEGYPGLVVHGPLQAVVLAEVARRRGLPSARVLSHRGLAPLFCGETARLIVDPARNVAEVRTGTGDDARTHARLELDPNEGES